MSLKTPRTFCLAAALIGGSVGIETYSQTITIAGPRGQMAEMRGDGGFSLRLPGRPPVDSGGILHRDGSRVEFWLIDYYSGLMAHAEAFLGESPSCFGRGRIEFYGPWPLGYIAFSGPAWEVAAPDEEEEMGPPLNGQSAPPGGGR